MDVAAPALRARELYRFFHAADDDEAFALRGVSLDVAAGEFVAITGPSGSGKSTLLSCLAGLDEPNGGRVEVGGQRITRRPEAEKASLRAQWIGMLLQSANLIEHLSVQANVAVAQALVPGRAGSRPAGILEELGLGGHRHARPSALSGGEAARAGLAVALANDPPVLLADEPTGEVDADTERVVLGLLRKRAEAGGAVVVVTHSARVAGAADRTITLADGRIVY